MHRILKALSVVGGLTLAASSVQADDFVRMVSGPSGGSWYPLGAKIMQVMQKDISGIATSNGPGGGVGNIKDVSEGNAGAQRLPIVLFADSRSGRSVVVVVSSLLHLGGAKIAARNRWIQ
jgi:hypothetical protein